jgi:hypothetical protein
MAQYKPGLHKDVVTIFNGIWNSQFDNIQQFVGPAGHVDFIGPKPPLILQMRDDMPKPSRDSSSPKPPKKEKERGFILSPQKRRERKRLKEISRFILPFE